MAVECPNCKKTAGIIQQWLDKQSHDRCWYYPELFRSLADMFQLRPTIPPELPSRTEFEKGCRRYQDEEYAK
jgi:hypothetical protein